MPTYPGWLFFGLGKTAAVNGAVLVSEFFWPAAAGQRNRALKRPRMRSHAGAWERQKPPLTLPFRVVIPEDFYRESNFDETYIPDRDIRG